MTDYDEKRRPGRPRKPSRKQRIDLTLSEKLLNAIDAITGNRSAHIEQALANDVELGSREAILKNPLSSTMQGLLGRFQDIVIRSIEPISIDTLTEEDWRQIRGPGALVGKAPVYSAWMVTWTPKKYANVPIPWKVMVVKSTSPITGEPAFLTTPARGEVPIYFER